MASEAIMVYSILRYSFRRNSSGIASDQNRRWGKLVIPVSFRRELGIQVGDTVVMELVDGELRVRSRDAAIVAMQKLVRGFVPEGVSVVDELIADRRAESAEE